jgi:activator of HSP90 ATPase
METKEIKHRVAFSATPETVYDAFMDSDVHSIFTQASAEISPEVGGTFSSYDGYILGTNVELEPGKRIVQKWRAVEDGWPADHMSEVIFEFEADGGEGTILLFTHKDVPADMAASFEKGWIEHYWEPMEAYFLDEDWDDEDWDDEEEDDDEEDLEDEGEGDEKKPETESK